MDYFAAQDAIGEDGTYASADFYRVERDDSIALGLRDKPIQILLDVMNHGADHAKQLLETALKRGHVKEIVDGGHTYYDVVDIEDVHGAPYQFRSHIAMQIAFPERYFKFFEGEHVWNYSHPKMQELIELCMSCLTNARHPSDYWGRHELPTEQPQKRGPGRPRTKEPEAVTKKTNPGHNAWMEACQTLKAAVSDAWNEYLETCQKRKEAKQQWDAWKAAELEKLKEQQARIEEQYQTGLSDWDKQVALMQQKHANLKKQPKPKREDY